VQKEFLLFDYLEILKKNLKKISILSIIVGIIITVIVFFVMDPIFLSTGTIKTSLKSNSLGGLLSGAGIPDIGELGDLAGTSSGAKEMALYENILTSRKNIDEALIKFKLNDEWEYKYMQDAVKNFRENVLEVKKDKLAGTMEIGIYDKNPQRAKEICEFMISQLNQINSDLNVLNAKNNREFIQTRYETAQKDLKAVEDSLKSFQDRFGISPDLQIKAAVQAEIQLEAEIKSEEIKLELLRGILSPDQAEVKTQEEKIKALQNQLNQINTSSDIGSNLTLKGKPDIIINFLRVQRNVEIQTKILTFLLPLYEQAKIEEKKNTPSVLIIDTPNLPEKKTKPKRMTFVLIAVFGTFCLTFLSIVILEKWKFYKASISK